MQWPWRRRRKQPRHAQPRQVAGWAQPAFPPAPPVPAPAPPPAQPVGVPEQACGVRLGFADGSEVALDERDPSALALRAVADLLVQDGPN